MTKQTPALPIPYGKQEILPQDLEKVSETLRSDYLTGGPAVKAFEEKFAEYIGASYAVACSSGTAALHLCTLALGVQPGDRVICSPITFVASTNCVLYQGGIVEFVDIDSQTRLMDLKLLEDKLAGAGKGHFKGIVGVDFAGHPIQMDRLRKIADKYGCWIIEDSCHAPGGSFQVEGGVENCGNGAFAELAIFSFHPVKHVATGEGGMVTTNSRELYERLLDLRNHGITRDRSKMEEDQGGWYYEMQQLGYNYRLSDIHASLGISQLDRAEQGLERRKEIARTYQQELKNLPIVLPAFVEGHAWHLYVIETKRRKELYDYLRENQIFVQIHYIPVHCQPYYRQFGWKKGDFPQAEAYYEACISLPMYPTLTGVQQEYVIEKIKNFFRF